MAGGRVPPEHLSKTVTTVLEPLLGRFTASKALDLAAKRCGRPANELESTDLPLVIDTLRPMLRTLLGAPTTRRVLEEIERGSKGGGAGE